MHTDASIKKFLSIQTMSSDDGGQNASLHSISPFDAGSETTPASGHQAGTSRSAPLKIVCFGSCPWHGLWQRHQQIMSRMGAKGHQVVFVDPTNLIPTIRGDEPQGKRIERINKNIIVVRPFFLPLHYRSRIIENFDAMVTKHLIDKALHALGTERPDVVWLYTPYYNFMIGKWDQALLLYDCVDAIEGDFCKHSLKDVVKEWLLKREVELITEADVVMAVSRGLMKRCEALSSNAHLVSNGSAALYAKEMMPEDLKGIRHPIVGYVGSISDWIDYDLLAKLALTRPDYSIVLVGPVDTTNGGTKKILGFKNVHFLGKKEFVQVPEYINSFDVCVIPFTLQLLTQMANPIKLFEYASLGKPTVSTPIDGVLDFSDLAYISNGSYEDFVNKIDIAMKEDSDVLCKQRMEAVKKNDWDSIVAKVESLIEGAARRKGAGTSQVRQVKIAKPLDMD